jgi:hypothetical protein
MRRPPESNKEVGYVVIPLFLQRKEDESLEKALERSDFNDVANVLNAMQEQDEDLVQIIRELKEAKGGREIFDPQGLSEKIEVLGPSIDLSTLRSNIFAEIIDTIGASWDEWYGRLETYKRRTGHCLVPHKYSENGFLLGFWVLAQRQNKKLSEERRRRLDQLGFVWDALDAAWEEGFNHLKIFKDRVGHCHVPHLYKEKGFRLGAWIQHQRQFAIKGTLLASRIDRLDEIG